MEKKSNILVKEKALQQRLTHLEHLLRKFSIQNSIIRIAAGASNQHELFEGVLSNVLALMEYECGGIYFVDYSEGVAEIVHSLRIPPEFLERKKRVPIDDYPYNQLFINGLTVITDHYEKIDPDSSKKFGFKTIASIPIKNADTVLGALNVASCRQHRMSGEEIDILKAISIEIANNIERIRMQELLREQRDHLQAMIDSVDDMLFVLDENGLIILTNKTACDKLGYVSAELQGRSFSGLHSQRQSDLGLLENISSFTDKSVKQLFTKDDRILFVETRISSGKWGDKNVLFASTRDITGRIKLEEQMIRNETFFRIISTVTPMGLLIADPVTDTVMFNNRKFCSIWGLDSMHEDSRLALTLPDLVASLASKAVEQQKLVEMFYEKGIEIKDIPAEYEIILKNGKTVRSVNLKVQDSEQRFYARFYLFEDITSRKRLEETNSAIVTHSVQSVAIVQDEKIVFLNDSFIKIADTEKINLIGLTISEFNWKYVHPDDQNILTSRAALIKQGENVSSRFTLRLIISDQVIQWYEFSTVPIYFQGRPATIVFGLNMTDYYDLQTLLLKNKQRLENILAIGRREYQSEHELFSDALDTMMKLTQSTAAYFHFVADDQYSVIPTYTVEINHKMTRNQMQAPVNMDVCEVWVETIVKRTPIVNNKVTWAVPDLLGNYITSVNRHVCIPLILNDKIIALYGVINKTSPFNNWDVDQLSSFMTNVWELIRHRRMFSALKVSQENLAVSIEVAKLAYWEYNFDSEEFILNDSFFKLFNTDINEQKSYILKTTDFSGRFPIFTKSDIEPGNFKKLVEAEPDRIEYRFNSEVISNNCLKKHFLVMFRVVRGKDRQPAKLRGIIQDITEERIMEQTLQETLLRLRVALDKEKEVNDLRARFISITSHEFRTPLTSILASADLLEMFAGNWEKEKIHEHIGKIQKAVGMLTSLLEDVSSINKYESSKLKLEPSFINLREIGEEVLSVVKVYASVDHILEYECDPNIANMFLDEKTIRQILSNLLTNAIKYSPNGGKVALRIKINADEVLLEVQDQGLGIIEEERGLIFNSFYRGTNVSAIQGSGLGLSIVKNLVALHGGRIEFETTENFGTTFYVFLPIKGKYIGHVKET